MVYVKITGGFSSPYEELVYIYKKKDDDYHKNMIQVFVPLRGISLYI